MKREFLFFAAMLACVAINARSQECDQHEMIVEGGGMTTVDSTGDISLNTSTEVYTITNAGIGDHIFIDNWEHRQFPVEQWTVVYPTEHFTLIDYYPCERFVTTTLIVLTC